MYRFYFSTKTELGAVLPKNLETEHCIWRNVQDVLEKKLLGRTRDDDFDIINSQLGGGQKMERAHKSILKGKVVGNCFLEKNLGLGSGENVVKELQKRSAALPYLRGDALLSSGDFLILWRVPVHFDAIRQIYVKGDAEKKEVPEEYQHLLRFADHSVSLSLLEDAPVLFGRHQWIAPSPSCDEAAAEKEIFTEAMNEDDRLQAVIEQAAGQGGGGGAQKRRREADTDGRETKRRSARIEQQKQKRSRVPPGDYLCMRCCIPGHWVQHCPTKHDARFDQKHICSAHGIPKHLLKRIENADSVPKEYNGQVFKDQEGRFYIRNEAIRNNMHAAAKLLFDRVYKKEDEEDVAEKKEGVEG